MDPILKEIYQNILDGQQSEMGIKIQAALESGIPPKKILDEGMIAAMAEVGRLFEAGEFYVPEMLISARAMQTGLNVLKPHLKEANVQSAGKVAIGTIKGDLHDIGKNLVAMMLEGAGFEILDLGTDVQFEKFVTVADDVDVIALSALLTTTMPGMKTVINSLQVAGKREKVKIIIGGAPVTQAYADSIGADGYASDASRAVAVTMSLLASK
ncbi:MAG: corrinoid protein [Anaerolineales bacterium]|jgi:5-methyltetrahydrofolate--homocysteine methyltransferase